MAWRMVVLPQQHVVSFLNDSSLHQSVCVDKSFGYSSLLEIQRRIKYKLGEGEQRLLHLQQKARKWKDRARRFLQKARKLRLVVKG